MLPYMRRTLAITCLLLVAMLRAASQVAPEPAYEGRSLNRWLEDLAFGSHPTPDHRRHAEEAVRAIGTNALPLLLQRLRSDDDSRGRRNSMEARLGFQALGPAAAPAIPDLLPLLRRARAAASQSASEPSQRAHERASTGAADALRAIGPEGFRALTNALAQGDADLRVGAAGALASFARVGGSEVVVSLYLRLLRDEDSDVRWVAARSLRAFPDAAERIVPALVTALHDTDSTVTFYAAGSLGQLRDKASAAAPALLAKLRTDTSRHAHFYIGPLKEIAPAFAERELTLDLESTNRQTQLNAIYALREFGAPSQPAIESLMRLMTESNSSIRVNAAITLKSVGLAALPGLTNLLHHASPTVRFEALRAMDSIPGAVVAARDELPALQQDADQSVRRLAARMWQQVEAPPPAPAASTIVRRPTWIPPATDPPRAKPSFNPQSEAELAAVIKRLREPATQLDALTKLLEFLAVHRWNSAGTSNRELSVKAYSALRDGPPLAPVVESLAARVKDAQRGMDERFAAVVTLVRLAGHQPYRIGGAFGRSSGKPDFDESCRQAALALTHANGPAMVERALAHLDRDIRWWGLEAFGHEGVPSESWTRLLPVVRKIAAEGDENVRWFALERLQMFPGYREFILTRLETEAAPNVLMRLVLAKHGRVGPEYRSEFLALFRPLLDDTNEAVRLAALQFIGGHNNPSLAPMYTFTFGPDVFYRVLKLSQSAAANERTAAVWALQAVSSVDEKQSVERFCALAQDASPGIRSSVVWALKKHRQTEDAERALNTLLQDAVPSVRFAAIQADGAARHLNALESLTKCDDAEVARGAAERLQQLRR